MAKVRGLIWAVFFLSICSIMTIFGHTAEAETPRKPVGITISPAFMNIVLDETKQNETFNFSVTNNTDMPYEFTLTVADFSNLDENGGVLFVGQTERKLNYQYGLTSWVALQKDRIVVEPKATQKVPVTVINKESLTPGGHYGAIMLTPIGSGGIPTKVQVNQVLSSLMFVKKTGGEIYNFGMSSFEMERSLFQMPKAVNFRFQNAGNVHVVPRGTITVTDSRGNVIKKGIINTGSGIVLPESYRQISTALQSVSKAWLPGTYTMTISYRFDGEEKTQSKEVTFMYIGVPLILLLILLMAGITALGVSRGFRKTFTNIVAAPAKIFKR